MCTVRNNPKANPYPVSWMRLGNNVVTLSSGPELQIKDHRMEMKHDADMSSYTLSITNVRKSDATKYRCQVSSIKKNSTICIKTKYLQGTDKNQSGLGILIWSLAK